VLSGVEVEFISTRFHETVIQAIVATMLKIQEQKQFFNRKVVLSGGSMHNRYLSQRLNSILKEKGFEVYLHHLVPCSDGGLSYGQLLVAAAKGRS